MDYVFIPQVVNRTPTLDKSKDSSRNRGDKDTCESPGECENPKRRISARRSRRNVIVEVEEHESNSNDSGLESASGGGKRIHLERLFILPNKSGNPIFYQFPSFRVISRKTRISENRFGFG